MSISAAGLGEGEVVRAEARVTTPVDLEEAGDEGLQGPLQVAHVDGAVDHQALDLVEHRRVGRVESFRKVRPGAMIRIGG
jgi:hypothetical protein